MDRRLYRSSRSGAATTRPRRGAISQSQTGWHDHSNPSRETWAQRCCAFTRGTRMAEFKEPRTLGSTPGSTGTATHSTETNSTSSGLVGKVREQATAQLSSQKDKATEGLGSVAQAVRQTTQHLRDNQHETVAHYAEQAAEQIERFSQGLKNKDVGELMNDAQRLARRQPALFVGGAFALGLLGARFLKSSSPETAMLRQLRRPATVEQLRRQQLRSRNYGTGHGNTGYGSNDRLRQHWLRPAAAVLRGRGERRRSRDRHRLGTGTSSGRTSPCVGLQRPRAARGTSTSNGSGRPDPRASRHDQADGLSTNRGSLNG